MLNKVLSLLFVVGFLAFMSCGDDCQDCTTTTITAGVSDDGVTVEICGDDEIAAAEALATIDSTLGVVTEIRVECN